jgi:dTDP-4-dehydrorhamnose reductase
MKSIVTGSSGLLGSALKRKLGESHLYLSSKDVDLRFLPETHSFLLEKRNVNTIN